MGPISPAIVSTPLIALFALMVCLGVIGAWAFEKWQDK
jgi:hypothetical protein